MTAKADGYRRAPMLEVVGIAVGVFFAAAAFAGCTLMFPPLLLISVPAVFLAPIVVVSILRKAIKGPCPYCGANIGPSYKPFNCGACKKRVLVNDGAFARISD
jgi:hypothetical protein